MIRTQEIMLVTQKRWQFVEIRHTILPPLYPLLALLVPHLLLGTGSSVVIAVLLPLPLTRLSLLLMSGVLVALALSPFLKRVWLLRLLFSSVTEENGRIGWWQRDVSVSTNTWGWPLLIDSYFELLLILQLP